MALEEGFVFALVGNKCDLPLNQIEVPSTQAMEIAKQHKMIQAEVSAKTGEGI